MEFPPENWEIFLMEDFDLAVPRDPGELGVELMAQARPNGRIQDHFRLAVGGTKLVELKLPVSNIINKQLPANWRLNFGVWPRDLTFRQNMVTTAWADIRDLVAAGEIGVETESSELVENEEFLSKLDAGTSKAKDKTSASVRWAIGIGDDLRAQLILQGLPGAASTVNGKPGLRGDNIPTVHLGTWPARANLLDGDKLAGLFPTLFSMDVEATAAALHANLAKTAKDIAKLNGIMFAHEGVSLEEAAELIKKPRTGNGVFHYKRQRFIPEEVPQAKRARIDTNAAGEPVVLSVVDLEDNLRQAEELLLEEREHTGVSFSQVADPGLRAGLLDKSHLELLRKRHPFLNEYSDSMLISTPIDTLLKLENTSIKLKNLEKARDVEEKLATNREALGSNKIQVRAGEDDRWSCLHESRFLPGAACSAAKMWLRGREVLGTSGQAAVSVYDMASVGLAGHVTPKGWLVLGDPGNSSISINLFSITNCGKKGACKADTFREDDLREIAELGELKAALRALREAMAFAQPWNKSVAALEGFLIQSNYCGSDLEGLDQQAALLVGFVDYVLRENSNRWRGQEPFMAINELKGAWDSFFGSRPQSQLARSRRLFQGQGKGPFKGYGQQAQQQLVHHQQQGSSASGQSRGPGGQQAHTTQGQVSGNHVPQAFFWEDICVMFNIGKCVKPPGTCMTRKGKPLRHVCNYRADPSKPHNYCGYPHASCYNH